jgi:hypothetical protein
MYCALIRSLAALAPLVLIACASQADGTSSAPHAATLGLAPAAPGAGLAVLRGGGSFLFALDESDPATKWHAHCDEECGAGTAQAAACYAKIRDVGGREGIRFAPAADGKTVWTSFGPEPGDEGIYIQVPLDLAADGADVVATPAGDARGTMAPRLPRAVQIRFEVPDARTVVMVDPHKGRLVYHRAAD